MNETSVDTRKRVRFLPIRLRDDVEERDAPRKRGNSEIAISSAVQPVMAPPEIVSLNNSSIALAMTPESCSSSAPPALDSSMDVVEVSRYFAADPRSGNAVAPSRENVPSYLTLDTIRGVYQKGYTKGTAQCMRDGMRLISGTGVVFFRCIDESIATRTYSCFVASEHSSSQWYLVTTTFDSLDVSSFRTSLSASCCCKAAGNTHSLCKHKCAHLIGLLFLGESFHQQMVRLPQYAVRKGTIRPKIRNPKSVGYKKARMDLTDLTPSKLAEFVMSPAPRHFTSIEKSKPPKYATTPQDIGQPRAKAKHCVCRKSIRKAELRVPIRSPPLAIECKADPVVRQQSACYGRAHIRRQSSWAGRAMKDEQKDCNPLRKCFAQFATVPWVGEPDSTNMA